MCSEVPLQVQENASFIVDLDQLTDKDDISADDLGAWEHSGSPKNYVEILCNGKGEVLDICVSRKQNKCAQYILRVKQFRHHDTSAGYRKRINLLSDRHGNLHRLALLEYFYEDGEVKKLNLRPHGNAKNSKDSFVKTKPSH